MKQKIVMGIVRALLASAGGSLVSAGWMDEATSQQMIGALLVIIAGVWSVIDKRRAAAAAVRLIPLALLVGVMAMGSGCFSYMATQSHNDRVEMKALQLQAAPDDKGAVLAVDLLRLSKGYFGAWSESPGTMTAATLGDLLTTGGAAYLLLRNNGGDGDDGGPADIAVTGNGNTTIVTSGDGSTTSYNRSETSGE